MQAGGYKEMSSILADQYLLLLIYLLALGGGPTFLRIFFTRRQNYIFYRHGNIELKKKRFSKLTGDDRNSGSVDTDRRPAGSRGYQRDQGRPQPRRG